MSTLFGTLLLGQTVGPSGSPEANANFFARERILSENNDAAIFRGDINSDPLSGSAILTLNSYVALKRSGGLGGSMGDVYFEKIRLLPNPILLPALDTGYDRVDGYIAFSDDQGNVSQLWARGERTVDPQQHDYSAWSTYFDRPVSVTSQSQDFRLATPASNLAFEQAEYKPGLKLLVLAGDGTLPVLTLLGPNPQLLQPNDVYSEYGATADDAFDGDLTDQIVIDASDVNTTVQDTYTVNYRVDDPNGNFATATRTVIVQDTIAPVITLTGQSSLSLERYANYIDAGATAFDAHDGDLTSSIVTFDNVDTSIESTYLVTYNVTDAAGNIANQAVRIVQVGAYFGHVLRARLDDGEVVLKGKLTTDLVLRGGLNE